MAEAAYSYRRLDVWQDAQALAEHVVRAVSELPRDTAATEIARQLIRAVGSIPANIAEGHGRFTLAAYRNHLLIARASACEADSWLDLLRRTGYISEDQEGQFHSALSSLIARLTAKARGLDERLQATGPRRVREEAEPYLAQPDESPDSLFA